MEVKEMLAEKRVKRTAVDMSKLKADGLWLRPHICKACKLPQNCVNSNNR